MLLVPNEFLDNEHNESEDFGYDMYRLWMYVLTLSHVYRLWAVIGAR